MAIRINGDGYTHSTLVLEQMFDRTEVLMKSRRLRWQQLTHAKEGTQLDGGSLARNGELARNRAIEESHAIGSPMDAIALKLHELNNKQFVIFLDNEKMDVPMERLQEWPRI